MKKVVLNYGSQAWVALMGLVFVPLYIRYLGSEAYGLIGFFTAASILLHTISMGIVPTLTREMARIGHDNVENTNILDLKVTFEVLALAAALVIFLAFYILTDFIALEWLKPKTIGKNTVVLAIQLMGIIISMRLIEAIYRSCLIGMGEISSFAIVSSGMATVRGVGAIIVLAFFDGDLNAFFGWNLVTTVVTVAILRTLVDKKLDKLAVKAKFRLSSLSAIRNFAVGMMLVSVTGSFLSQVDRFLLSGLMPLDSYGGFVIAANLAAIIFMAVSPLSQAIFPDLSAAFFKNDTIEFSRLFLWSVKLVTILASTIAFSLALNPSEVLSIWTGSAELALSLRTVFVILCFASVFSSITWIPQQAQFALGETMRTVKLNASSFLILLGILPFAFRYFGLIGCVLSVLVISFFYAAAYLYMSRKYLVNIGLGEFLMQGVVIPMFFTLLCTFFFKTAFLVVDLPIIIELVISGFCSVLVLLMFFNYLNVSDFKNTLTHGK